LQAGEIALRLTHVIRGFNRLRIFTALAQRSVMVAFVRNGMRVEPFTAAE
jgi:hypothetical protein